MAQDIGGGSKGQGGALADSTDPVVANPVANRNQVDYTPPLDVGAAASLTEVATAADDEVAAGAKQFQIISFGADTLVAAPFENDTAGVPAAIIAKSPNARKTDFDTKIIDNELFEYATDETEERKVTHQVTGDIRFETMVPAYKIGEIIYAAESSNGTGLTNITLVDINVTARRFIPDSPQRFQLQEVKDETLRCRRIFSNQSIDTVDVEVARAEEYRKSTFDGQTVDDVTFVYSGPEAREATDSTGAEDIVENQLIIPPYRTGTYKDIIYAERVPDTGITTTQWLEDDKAGRQWQMDALDTPAP